MTVVVVHGKERNAVLMGETREDLFLNVQCSWLSIHIATFKVRTKNNNTVVSIHIRIS